MNTNENSLLPAFGKDAFISVNTELMFLNLKRDLEQFFTKHNLRYWAGYVLIQNPDSDNPLGFLALPEGLDSEIVFEMLATHIKKQEKEWENG